MHDETSIVRRYLPRMPNASSGAELDRGDSICSVSPYDRTNAIVLFQAVDDRDVRVIEGREDCGFALETLTMGRCEEGDGREMAQHPAEGGSLERSEGKRKREPNPLLSHRVWLTSLDKFRNWLSSGNLAG